MAIKKILVPLDGSNGSIEALRTAFVVADRFDAHIDAIHVLPRPSDIAPFMFDRLSAKMKQTFENEAAEDARETAAAIKTAFEQCCAQNEVPIVTAPPAKPGVTASWQEDMGRASEVLVHRARLSDMVAVARPRASRSRIRRSPAGETLQAVMLGCGRPVMLVPPNWKASPVAHAAIGWNDSLEVSRALAATIPWLQEIETVTVVTSKRRKASVPVFKEYLSWHGIQAGIEWLDSSIDAVEEALLKACSNVGADLLVVGGFSTARARQMLFGGVTRHLLAHTNILTVMVH